MFYFTLIWIGLIYQIIITSYCIIFGPTHHFPLQPSLPIEPLDDSSMSPFGYRELWVHAASACPVQVQVELAQPKPLPIQTS